MYTCVVVYNLYIVLSNALWCLLFFSLIKSKSLFKSNAKISSKYYIVVPKWWKGYEIATQCFCCQTGTSKYFWKIHEKTSKMAWNGPNNGLKCRNFCSAFNHCAAFDTQRFLNTKHFPVYIMNDIASLFNSQESNIVKVCQKD